MGLMTGEALVSLKLKAHLQPELMLMLTVFFRSQLDI